MKRTYRYRAAQIKPIKHLERSWFVLDLEGMTARPVGFKNLLTAKEAAKMSREKNRVDKFLKRIGA